MTNQIGPGRPRISSSETTKPYTVSLTPSEAETLRNLGNGNLTTGIRKAIDTMTTTDAQAPQITVQQLRQILFELADQDMTIRDLRAKLFDIENQHQPITPDRNMWKTLGIE